MPASIHKAYENDTFLSHLFAVLPNMVLVLAVHDDDDTNRPAGVSELEELSPDTFNNG